MVSGIKITIAFHLMAELWMDPMNCWSVVAKQQIKIQGKDMPGSVCQVSIRSILQKLIFFHWVQFNFIYIAFAAITIVSRKLFLIGKKNPWGGLYEVMVEQRPIDIYNICK